MTNLLVGRQFLKQKLHSIRMLESKIITEQLIEFNKILDNLVNIEVKIKDERSLWRGGKINTHVQP